MLNIAINLVLLNYPIAKNFCELLKLVMLHSVVSYYNYIISTSLIPRRESLGARLKLCTYFSVHLFLISLTYV